MAKAMTYEEFIEYAKKHYTKGGDSFFECWGKSEFNYFVQEFGAITKSRALEMFRTQYDIDRDRAGW